MHICEKINMDRDGLIEHGPITIVAFGDSVTYGAFEEGVVDYEAVYWNRLREKLLRRRAYVPVNVINAGIGGVTAKGSVERLDAQVLAHRPDLVIVCFGLNDINGALSSYTDALCTIFERCRGIGADVIFMTPNMLNTRVTADAPERYKEYAQRTAQMQNDGRMDAFMAAAVQTARKMGVAVCDCYGAWKEMSKTQDVTALLANGINHPIREMHALFADMLYDVIFEEV